MSNDQNLQLQPELQMSEKQSVQSKPPKRHEWLSALVMAFLALPFIALLFICAYGFINWFGQMLFWGPPT